MAAETTDSSSQTKTFNQSEFVFEVYLIQETCLFQKFGKDEILKLELVRDLDEHFMKGSVLVKDTANYGAILARNDGTWYIGVNIIQTEVQESVEKATFNKTFIVSNANVENITDERATIRINFIDPISQIFYRNISYSNQEYADMSDVITGLLKKAGFDEEAESGPNVLPEIEACDFCENFITPTNSPLVSSLDYLLTQTQTNEKGFLFLYFDDYKSQLKAIWSRDVVNEEIDVSDPEKYEEVCAYTIILSSSDKTSRNDLIPTEIMTYSETFPYFKTTNLIYPTYIREFDYKNCEIVTKFEGSWDITKFEDVFTEYDGETASLTNMLEDPSKMFGDNLLFYKEAPTYKIGNFYRDTNVDTFRRKLREYYMKKNLVSFKLLGKIWREPGKAYFVDYMQYPGVSKYAGSWFCTKIVDTFEGQDYYQYVFLVRSSDSIDYEEVKTNTEDLKSETEKREQQ